MMNHPAGTYELIYPPSLHDVVGHLREEQMIAHYSEEYARKSDTEAEKLIQARKERLLGASSMYAGYKFRLAGVQIRHRNHLEVCLGPTDYFDYLLTNHNRELNSKLIEQGMMKHRDPDAFLSNALGNVAIVSTLDGKVALLLRSGKVATFSGYYDLPGGHPEPDWIDEELSFSSLGLVKELFDSIVREAVDELNLPRSSIYGVSCLGFVRSMEDGRKPEMIFHLPVNLNARALKECYSRGGKEKNESKALIMVNDFSEKSISVRMTAPTIAALRMYEIYIEKMGSKHAS